MKTIIAIIFMATLSGCQTNPNYGGPTGGLNGPTGGLKMNPFLEYGLRSFSQPVQQQRMITCYHNGRTTQCM